MTTMAYAIGEPPPIMRYGCGEPLICPRPGQVKPWTDPDCPTVVNPPVVPKIPKEPSNILDRLRQQLAEVRAAIAKIEADQAYLPELRHAESALAAAVERRTVGEEVDRKR